MLVSWYTISINMQRCGNTMCLLNDDIELNVSDTAVDLSSDDEDE